MSIELANKIAAGEVVQRPASVVKELIENSLDANATHIAVVVKDAGKALIHIVDNGDGMSDADAKTAFERHATSKISSVDDLERLATFGFRGEALAAIASVSQIEMKTRTRDSEVGTLIRIEGSRLKEHSKTGIEPGTSVSVRNLFYNTPARRNFLKSPQTELKAIVDIVTRIAVAHPEVSWFFQHDDDMVFDLKAKQIEGRVADVFGDQHAQSLIRLTHTYDYITIDGFIGKPDLIRKTRIEQFLYMNKRPIYNKAINHAVFQAYEHLMEHGGYPFFILNVIVDPKYVDVNVHPSKTEVKFADESAIYRSTIHAVRKALREQNLFPAIPIGENASPGFQPMRHSSTSDQSAPVTSQFQYPGQRPGTQAPILPFPKFKKGPSESPVINREGPATLPPPDAFERILAEKMDQAATEQVLSHTSIDDEGFAENRPVWQIHQKYILSQVRTGLLIIDQHVAHERVLYEKIFASFENNLPSTQQLLFPEAVQLSPNDYVLVKELWKYLEQIGFVLAEFGKNAIKMEGVPVDVRVGEEKRVLFEILDEYRLNLQGGLTDARDNLAKSFACKAAIKAGDKLTTNEMISLIDHLFATSMPHVCPHGRPVIVKLGLDELDKRFGRPVKHI